MSGPDPCSSTCLRKPFLIFVTTLALAISTAAYLLHRRQNSPCVEKTPAQAAESNALTNGHGTAPESGKQQKHRAGREASPQFAEESGAVPEHEKYEAYLAEKVASLADLGMESDPASLDLILAELASPDAEIRSAAREAAVQFGSRDAIPALQNALSQRDDPDEKAALANAIEFLGLTNVTEVIQQKSVSK